MEKRRKQKLYVIGVDGGGTKTDVALADLKGKILAIARSGPASPRNLGIETSVSNIAKGIKEVLKKTKKGGKIISTFVALPSVQEEYSERKDEILEKLKAQKGISKILKGKILIGPDQIACFRAGTNEKDGILLIAGTGCVAHGWRAGKEHKASGWGYFSDEGSAFWTGQKVFQAILKDLDGRGPKTLLTPLVFKKFQVKTINDFLQKIYSENHTIIFPRLSVICDEASKKKDEVAKEIMTEAAKNLALSVKQVIKILKFQKIKFPVVLTGSMFKSRIILKQVCREIKGTAPRARFIRPRKKAVSGAVRLAIENIQG